MNIDKIIKFENGELSNTETVELFSELVKTKMAWSLQGSYGRMAMNLIQNGILDKQGNILYEVENE